MTVQSPFAATPRSSWYALALLFLVSVFNFLDRTIIGILQIPMKTELNLTDTQVGVLVGGAFGLVYTLAGLPLGRLADRTSRKWVLAGAIAVWTGLTALSGLVHAFVLLVVCRMGVALGEAACAPVSHSLISDLFPAHRRGTAIAIWALGVPLGIILGFLLGGVLNAALGWRLSFVLVGLVGALLAPAVLFLFKDPPRGAFDSPSTAEIPMPSLRTTLSIIWRSRTYRMIIVAASLQLFTFHALNAWLPQFYARTYHLPIAEIGGVMALIAGVGGAIGMFVGGLIGDRLARRDERWRLWVPAIASSLSVPLALAQYWAPSVGVSIALGLVTGALVQVFFAPMIALTQSLMPARIRSFTGAFYVSSVNIFAMTLGPILTGRLSDLFGANPATGDNALRLALSIAQIGSLASILFFILAARTVRADLPARGEIPASTPPAEPLTA